jgi:hypothetical protein
VKKGNGVKIRREETGVLKIARLSVGISTVL